MPFENRFDGRRVLLTGHTGFKGSWLAAWLLELGADVFGLGLPPSDQQPLFEQLELASRLSHRIGDIRDLATVQTAIAVARPDFVFHLAAQPLVRQSYEQPVETFATNVLGTAHVLDAVRQADRECTVVVVTSDKCYENREWVHSYRENDPLGGHDPYSASKGAAELVVASYQRSFFTPGRSRVRLASARAGNVIGGGDWAADRIVPDAIRSLGKGDPIPVRNPRAIRPWQHVLEPLSGYLHLAASLHGAAQHEYSKLAALSSPFNFGPWPTAHRTVGELVREVLKHWPGNWVDRSDPSSVHEAHRLGLAIDKAFQLLEWGPVWGFEQAVEKTVAWYRQCNSNATARQLTVNQIADYVASAQSQAIAWTE